MSAQPIMILGLGGGLRTASRSRAALREALAFAEEAGAQTRLFDLQSYRLPLYQPDVDTPAGYGPQSAPLIEQFLEAIRRADGYLWASPAYHGSMSGAVKNALDFAQFLAKDQPSFLYGKSVGLLSTGAGSIGAVNVITQLTHVAHGLRAQVVPLAAPIVSAANAFDHDRLIDEQVRQRLKMLADELVRLTRLHRR